MGDQSSAQASSGGLTQQDIRAFQRENNKSVEAVAKLVYETVQTNKAASDHVVQTLNTIDL